MSKVLCESQDLTNIADAIREKTNTTDTMAVSSMAYNINSISNNGISDEYIAQIEQNTSNINQLQQEIVNVETGAKEYTDTKITDLKAQGVQQAPLFANSVEDMTDTSKVYVLNETGRIWGYKKVTIAGGKAYTNLAEPNTTNKTDTSIWVNDHRISSSGVSAQSGKTVSNPVDMVKGDIIRVKGVEFVSSADRLEYLTPEGAFHRQYVSTLPDTIFDYSLVDGVHTFTVISTIEKYASGNIRFAFTTPTDPSTIIITKNQEIKETEPYEGYAWTDTGRSFVPNDYDDEFVELNQEISRMNSDISSLKNTTQTIGESVEMLENKVANIGTTEIPSYWESHLNSKIATIKGYHKQFGKDCFSFISIADIHYPSNLGKLSPTLAKKIADECNIKHILGIGDFNTRGCNETKTLLLEENEAILNFLKPILDKLLMQKGNHDGAFGFLDRDGDGTYNNNDSSGNIKEANQRETYVHNLTQEEFHEYMYRKVGMIGNVYFDKTGTAYYVDDISNNVRYIGLNTQYNKYELQADGTQKYPTMWLMNFTQPQFDFLINKALVGLDEDTKVIPFGHVPLWQEIGDREVMIGVLNAFKNKTTYSGTYNGVADYDQVYVNVDFTNAKGKLVGYFAGHNHDDINTTNKGFNIITTRCDAKEEHTEALQNERVVGTTTEQSFDVFTVTSDTIYVTKIGAGSDRVISY